MRCSAKAVLALVIAAAFASAECETEYVQTYWTTPSVPCVHVEGGCDKNTVYVSNYCEREVTLNPGRYDEFTIPQGASKQEITLGGRDPAPCISGCVFFNENLEWDKNNSCALECEREANNYALDAKIGDTGFLINGAAIPWHSYTSPEEKRMTIAINYALPAAIIIFLLLQLYVYKTDRFVFDDHGMRNLLVVAASAVAYAALVYLRS